MARAGSQKMARFHRPILAAPGAKGVVQAMSIRRMQQLVAIAVDKKLAKGTGDPFAAHSINR